MEQSWKAPKTSMSTAPAARHVQPGAPYRGEEKPTINVERGQDDTVDGRDGREQQRGQTGAPQPIHLLAEDARRHEHIVPGRPG